jgi:phosphoserine phosphatase
MNIDQTIKLVCFDMDGTLITENSWYKLNLALGITAEEDQDMYDAYISGDLPYGEWIDKISSLYRERGLATKEHIAKVLESIPLVEGAKEVIGNLKDRDYKVAIITGSFDFQAQRVAESLGVEHYIANTKMIFDADENFKNLVPAGDEIKNKPGQLLELCEELGVKVEECLCVGDGVGDVELFKLPVKGVALSDAPDELKQLAWKEIDSLSELGDLV